MGLRSWLRRATPCYWAARYRKTWSGTPSSVWEPAAQPLVWETSRTKSVAHGFAEEHREEMFSGGVKQRSSDEHTLHEKGYSYRSSCN